MRRKFHLIPEMRIKAVFKDGKQWIVACGIYKSGMWNDERTEWIESPPDEEGKFWWNEPDLIAIVYPKKSSHRCDICGNIIKGRPPRKRRGLSTLLPSYWDYKSVYVGICDGCLPPYWGYDTKICLDCAKRIFKDVKVYECDGWDSPSWSKDPPKIEREIHDFIEILEKVK